MAKKKKPVKPTAAEQDAINARLERKYPGRKYAVKEGFMDRLRGKLKNVFSSGRTESVTKDLKRNLTDAEIRKLRGKK